MSNKPNIIIFNVDQWRGDVMGHLGNPAAITPFIDQVVEEDAVSFSNAFCQNPVCTPSRCSFMSGWYPHVGGHRTMFHMMDKHEPVLLKTLKEKGYFVWWGGKNDLVPKEYGFEEYCHVKYKPDRKLAPNLHADQGWRGKPDGDNYYSFFAGKLETPKGESVYYDSDWANVDGAIEQIKNHDGEKPLCIYLALGYPHPPYGVEDPWFSMIDRGKIPKRIAAPVDWKGKPSLLKGIWERQNLQGWTEERWTELRATYYGMCSRVDYQFGLLIEALKEVGIYDNTVIFFFSDHGDFTGDYGLVEKTQNTFEDCLTNVPFIIKPPANIPMKPGVREALVELIDFPATVEDLLGYEPAHSHFGKSLLPLLDDSSMEHRDAVFCEGGRLHGEEHCMENESVEQNSLEGLYWPRVGLQSSENGEHTKAVMCRTKKYKYVMRLYEADELYNLEIDSKEQNNLIDDPAYADVKGQLKERLLRFYMDTSDVVPHIPNQR